jgi:hypothetical protein
MASVEEFRGHYWPEIKAFWEIYRAIVIASQEIEKSVLPTNLAYDAVLTLAHHFFTEGERHNAFPEPWKKA